MLPNVTDHRPPESNPVMILPSSLYCAIPRLEAALEGEPPSSGCPHCRHPVFGPGWWCDNCSICVFPGMILDADYEPEPIEPDDDEEPDDDYR
jgi:hypothetical protein